MATFSTKNIPRSSKGGGGGGGTGGTGGGAAKQDWVTALQNKLVEKSKELNAPIDLGPTGVDGVYGKKTRRAVEVIAKALKIESPLDANGRPTQEFKTKIGLGETGAGTSESSTTPAKQTSADASGEKDPGLYFLNDVEVDGRNIGIGVLEAGLPSTMTQSLDEGGQKVALSPAEALSRFVAIRDAMSGAGFTVSATLPSFRNLASAADYARAGEQLEAAKKELDSHLFKLKSAIVSKIAEKRKAMGLPPQISEGAPQQAYKAERSTALFPNAIAAGLATAYGWLRGYLAEMEQGDKTNPQSLLAVMKRNTGVAVDRNYPHDTWNEEQARQVGSVLKAAGGWLGERIVQTDTSQYYKGPYRDDIIDKEWTSAFKKNSNEIWKIIRGQK